MSLHTVGSDAKYILPASYDSVPQAFMSNKSAKPIPSSVQTVNIPALTANANANGTSILQLPCGSSAGIMLNPYIRLDVTPQGGGAGSEWQYKGVAKCATSILNRVSSYINGIQVDNIQNADRVYDDLFSHSTSYDWLSHDAQVLMDSGAGRVAPINTGLAAQTYVIPLIGMMGTQQGLPLFAMNGTLQIQLDYNSLARSITQTDAGAALTGFQVSNVQLVYDKVSVEQAFVDKVKSDMAMGNKYVIGYTNFQSTTLATLNGTAFFNYGLNVSSLRAVTASQILTAALTTLYDANPALSDGRSAANGLTQFQCSLDGRLINSNTLNAVASPALVFAETNKCFSRLFDASITDISTAANFATETFLVGVSAQRCNEALAFSGSPVSVVGLNIQTGAAGYTLFITFVSDYQLLVDASGSVEIVR